MFPFMIGNLLCSFRPLKDGDVRIKGCLEGDHLILFVGSGLELERLFYN